MSRAKAFMLNTMEAASTIQVQRGTRQGVLFDAGGATPTFTSVKVVGGGQRVPGMVVLGHVADCISLK